MPPQSLQIGPPWQNGVPSFAQQGQVDWVAFGNTVWSLSAAMLQRFASSGIQPVTYGAGLAIASRFRMSSGGRQRMDQTMRSLRGIPALEKILWFGFGHQSFVRIMGDNQLGLNCVALCSCLAEVHSEETSARVLEGLWEVNSFPENYEPSHTQFLALVKACSGVVARSGFGRDLDAMTGHGVWRFGRHRTYNEVLKASNASDISKALNALFQITRGEVETITLLGQNECAFIAACASWLFDFAIYIEDDTGEVLFKSYENLSKEGAQVLVIYTEEQEPTALQQSTTYVLPLGTDMISRYLSNSESRWIWKVPWDGCLARTFGAIFTTLAGLSQILGSYLGSAARVYAALATGEPNVAAFSRHRFIEFTQLSYGQGFIHSVTSNFEELERIPGLYNRMERVLGSSFDNACKEMEEAAQSLRNICHCELCSSIQSADMTGCGSGYEDCLFTLAMTIRSLVTDLACTNRDEALLVAVYGLQGYYAKNHEDYKVWLEQKEHNRTLVGMAAGLASVTDPENISVNKSELLIHEIRQLFDGSMQVSTLPDIDLDDNTATASSGICCYRECLTGISSKAAAMRVIHVVPGHIERGTAQYDTVSDGKLAKAITSDLESTKLTQADNTIRKYKPISQGKF